MGSLKIREAVEADIAQLCHVHRETWLDTYPNDQHGIMLDDILDKDYFSAERSASWKERMQEKDKKLLVALVDDKIVGFCETKREAPNNILEAIYVLPASQGLGIGKKLVSKSLAWLANDNPLELQVASYNASSIGFYERLGFVATSEKIKPYILPNGKKIPLIKMLRSSSRQNS